MSNTPSAPCPQCRAKNFTHRRVCWKCGRTLPTSFGLENAKAYDFTQPAAESTSLPDIALVPVAPEVSTAAALPELVEEPAARAEFRELVRGLLEKTGVY